MPKIKRIGRRGKKLYKGYKKKRQHILDRSRGKCEVVDIRIINFGGHNKPKQPIRAWERCAKHGAMVDHITPRGMAGANSQWLNDERNLMMLCLDHSETGRHRTYREEKYRSLQTLYPDLDWGSGGPWTEFLTEQREKNDKKKNQN